ncbi:hypothetical protein GCM10009527_022280 [Actinomadura nitritigenes]
MKKGHWDVGVAPRKIVEVGDERVFGWWGGAGVRGRPSKVKGAFGVASRWTSSTLDFGASAAPEAALGAGSACPARVAPPHHPLPQGTKPPPGSSLPALARPVGLNRL